MSGSRKKNPYHGATTAQSEKLGKRTYNSALRQRTKAMLRHGAEEGLPNKRDVSDQYGMSKDGKIRFDQGEFPDLMRK